LPQRKAEFIEPMECALVASLPEGPQWTYEAKLDGHRAIAVKTSRDTIQYSRNGKNFNKRYPYIVEALSDLPSDTVIDGEVVALDNAGRPSFHNLQHFQAAASRIRYFVFDLLVAKEQDVTELPLSDRRGLLGAILKPRPSRIRLLEQFHVPADQMLAAVRGQHLKVSSPNARTVPMRGESEAAHGSKLYQNPMSRLLTECFV
jgi:bifunctional non-homologous end joining protein LigD